MLQDKATSDLMSAQEEFSLLLHDVLRVKVAETASSQRTPSRHYNLTAGHFPHEADFFLKRSAKLQN